MPSSGFPGFPAEALQFLRGLEKNNRREWFEPRKTVYEEQVRAPMLELVAALNARMRTFAPDFVREPERAVYRIYRDIRFSHDKTPYKTHIAAVFTRRGFEKHAGAGYYVGLSAKEIDAAGGVYMPSPEELRAIRLHLVENHAEFNRILSRPSVRKTLGSLEGEKLSRVPKGFPAEHPSASLVQHKQWLLWSKLDPALATTPQLFVEILQRFRAMAPFIDFLNAPLANLHRKPDPRAFLD
jgi:uncharacterized protein (TIGR02453 family)